MHETSPTTPSCLESEELPPTKDPQSIRMADQETTGAQKDSKPKRDVYWPGVLLQLYTISSLFYGFHFMRSTYWTTIIFDSLLVVLGILGVTAGSHRLWAHRSYGANLGLRIFLMLCQTLTLKGSIYDWVLDHRLHHKHHGTDDDPYNYNRGWFYAHMGHSMLAENPRYRELAKEIDMSDIEQDRVVMFQKRFYWFLAIVFGLLLPINAPVEYWGESLLNSVMVIGLQRISIAYHASYLVNSAQTIWGLKPNDRFFSDSNWIYVIRKSYWHDYHYNVPWDVLTNEFGSYNCGCTTVLIKMWAALGWAHGLRTIDSWGIRRALEKYVDSKKPLTDCINEMEEIVRDRLPEDYHLLDRTNWPKK